MLTRINDKWWIDLSLIKSITRFTDKGHYVYEVILDFAHETSKIVIDKKGMNALQTALGLFYGRQFSQRKKVYNDKSIEAVEAMNYQPEY